jgi:hypothetical protein
MFSVDKNFKNLSGADHKPLKIRGFQFSHAMKNMTLYNVYG